GEKKPPTSCAGYERSCFHRYARWFTDLRSFVSGQPIGKGNIQSESVVTTARIATGLRLGGWRGLVVRSPIRRNSRRLAVRIGATLSAPPPQTGGRVCIPPESETGLRLVQPVEFVARGRAVGDRVPTAGHDRIIGHGGPTRWSQCRCAFQPVPSRPGRPVQPDAARGDAGNVERRPAV